MSDPKSARGSSLSECFRRLLQAINKIFRMLAEPGMVESQMVWHEIQDQFHPIAMKLLAKF